MPGGSGITGHPLSIEWTCLSIAISFCAGIIGFQVCCNLNKLILFFESTYTNKTKHYMHTRSYPHNFLPLFQKYSKMLQLCFLKIIVNILLQGSSLLSLTSKVLAIFAQVASTKKQNHFNQIQN